MNRRLFNASRQGPGGIQQSAGRRRLAAPDPSPLTLLTGTTRWTGQEGDGDHLHSLDERSSPTRGGGQEGESPDPNGSRGE